MKQYIRKVISLTSLVFTLLVCVNLITNKQFLLNNIGYFLFISTVSGLLIFMLEDKETYSNRRLILNQLLYISIILLNILSSSYLFNWKMSAVGLLINFLLVIGIFFFIKLFMYGQDKIESQHINDYLQKKRS